MFDERLKEAKTATNKDLGTDEQRAVENEDNLKNYKVLISVNLLVRITLLIIIFDICLFINHNL